MGAGSEIEWLIQTTADHPGLAYGIAPRDLLSRRETAVYQTLAHAKRREDWLLGRWTAKRLAQVVLAAEAGPCAAADLSILAAADGAPQLWLDEDAPGPYPAGLSISHTHGVAFCAMSCAAGAALGADIERITPRHPAFVGQYFTSAEQTLLLQAPPAQRECLITAIWSAKEAALKALRCGLRLDTRQVCCAIRPADAPPRTWAGFTISHLAPDGAALASLQGWWLVWQGFVLALAYAGDEQTAVAPTPLAATLHKPILATQTRPRPLEERSWLAR